jgi:arylsulfatase A-like enzyme
VIIEDLSRGLRRSALTEPAELSGAMQTEARRRGALLRPLVEEVLRQEERPALLMLSSAHGLSLGEQSGADNMPTQAVQSEILLERTLHVPLYLAGDVQPGERSEVVELLDLLPTALAAAGAEAPAGISGHDLRGPLPADRYAYAEYGDMLALRGPQYLLSGRFWRHGGSALDPELSRRLEAGPGAPQSTYHLHDIRADPLQERDLAGDAPELLARMWAEMRRRRGAEAAPPRGGLSPEQLEGLRAVQSQGYW